MAQLRQFLYRDGDLIREFLSQLEGGIFDEDAQTLRSGRRSGMTAGLKAGPVMTQGDKHGDTSDELARVVRQTGVSEFDRLFRALDSRNAIQYLDNIDERIWGQLQRGDIVEVEAVVRLGGFQKMLELMNTVQELLPLAQSMGSGPSLDSETMQAMELMRQLAQAGPKETTSVIARLASAFRFKFACSLRETYILVDKALLEGEVTVCGKIQRKLKRKETYIVGGFFAGLEDILPRREQEELIGAFDNPELKALGVESPEIKYPAAILTPIAIYR
jgi:hypothetical protein